MSTPKFDIATLIPHPKGRANHWIEVRRIPQRQVDHGRGQIEIIPEQIIPTGRLVVTRAGQSLVDFVEQLNAEEE